MKLPLVTRTLLALLMLFGCTANLVWAQGSGVHSYAPHFGENGWSDGSLGFGLSFQTNGSYLGSEENNTDLALLGGITYIKDPFFFTFNDDDFLLLGLNLHRSDTAVLELLFGPKFAMEFEGNSDLDGQLDHLEDREIDGHLGFRYSLYGRDHRWAFSISRDVTGAHGGYFGVVDYVTNWQIRNWVVSGAASLGYVSKKMTNHIIGVSNEEATLAIPAFQANRGGYLATLELKAEYPLTENWVFQTEIALDTIDNLAKESPIIENDSYTSVLLGVKYHF
jgi:outer membrane scaffolding protein for murein synthesis (MipA/OmpV family)